MKSLKTYLSLAALVFSLSAFADRSRDTGHKGSHSKQSSQQHYGGKKHQNKVNNRSYQRQNNARKEVRGNNDAYKSQSRNGNNKHRNNGPKGFSGDYRNNRHFDNSSRRYNSYGHSNRNNGHNRHRGNNKHYGYNRHNRSHISHNYYKPKKYYSKWKKQNHRYWKNKYRHFSNYQVYRDDLYRYRPLRGLGHYFVHPGYGYGHWHEGGWCASHHSERYYQNYYSAYPYRDGWRRGDGDFGIWFSFNL